MGTWGAFMCGVRVCRGCVCTWGCTPRGVVVPGDAHAWGQRGYEVGVMGGCGIGDIPVGLQMCERRDMWRGGLTMVGAG